MKKNQIVPTTPSLPQIIKRVFQSKKPFEELLPIKQAYILRYINNHNLDIIILGKRGYDILKKTFFAFRNELVEDKCQKVRYDFPNFSKFFAFVRGEIYERSCFFGYRFSKAEIDRYSIDLERINFNAFITTRCAASPQSLQNEIDERRANASTIYAIINDFLKNVPTITTFNRFRAEWTRFRRLCSSIPVYKSERIFYSHIIRLQGDRVKPYVIESIRHILSCTLSIMDFFFFYGKDVIQWDGLSSKEKNCFDYFNDPNKHFLRRGGVDDCTNLFYISFDEYCGEKLIRKDAFVQYFVSFTDFADALDGRLSNCDFSIAPLSKDEICKYQVDETTLFPVDFSSTTCIIEKQYRDGLFRVAPKYYTSQRDLIRQEKETCFEWFFDFVYYLNGDLTNADLIMCDEIENVAGLTDLKIDGLKVRSEVAKQLRLPLNLVSIKPQDRLSFDLIEQNESDSYAVEQTMHETDGDYASPVAYVTDLHLLHRFTAYHCETNEDRHYVLRTIARMIKNDCSRICLIGGDISSDFPVFQSFISYLFKYQNPDCFIKTDFFFTIGNHELWSFPDTPLVETITTYRSILQDHGMYLVQNNLFYYSPNSWLEITADELEKISENELRAKTRSAYLIIFGGMGFAGNNTTFNANQGIYRGAVDRELEIKECEKFNELHRKVSRALYDKNVIVFTHMPIDDWLLDKKTTDGFVYVNGHRHINKYFDDGKTRIYSDNQIGYKRKEVALKHFSINMDYDWFSDYPDGIHEITAEDYRLFYRGINEYVGFNRSFAKIYMLKREQTFMFVAEKENGKLFLLMGGQIKTLEHQSLQYYYEKMVNYSESVKLFISDYSAFQKQVADEVKKIGGKGKIHGCIVDIDYLNHLYINPFDGTITPYFALSMTHKLFYENYPSLLKDKCPSLYLAYSKMIRDHLDNPSLPVLYKNDYISTTVQFEPSTEMYRFSWIIKKLQALLNKNVIQVWNDSLVEKPSKEIGKQITAGLLKAKPKP